MPSRHPRLRAALAAAVLVLSLAPAAVLGHAELDTASPADKSSVAGSPPELVFTFTEALVPAKSSLKLVNSAGTIVAEGSTVDPTDAKKMHLAVPTQPPGMYTVRWTTASADDGDLAHGTTTFTIVAASPSPSVAPSEAANPSVAPSASASPSASTAEAPPPSPSGGTGTTTTSTSDAVFPVIGALLVLAALGLWLLRSRARRVG